LLDLAQDRVHPTVSASVPGSSTAVAIAAEPNHRLKRPVARSIRPRIPMPTTCKTARSAAAIKLAKNVPCRMCPVALHSNVQMTAEIYACVVEGA